MVINKLLCYSLLVLGVYFYFFPYKFAGFYWILVLSFATAVIFWFVCRKLGLSETAYTIVLCIIWTNALGEFYFYYHISFYDKILHTINPFFISYLYYKYLRNQKLAITWTFPFTMLGFLAFSELIEWLVTMLTGFPMIGIIDDNGVMLMSAIDDTMYDLLCGITGTLFFFGGVYYRRELDYYLK